MIPSPDSGNGQADHSATAKSDLVNRVKALKLGAAPLDRPNGWSIGRLFPWVLCLVLAVAWASVGVKFSRPPAPPPPPEVPKASIATSGDIALQLKGNLVPFLQVAVSPIDVAGEVIEVNFKEGDLVKKGHELVKLRADRYQNEMKTAEANVLAAKGKLEMLLPKSVREIEKEQARAELEDAKSFLDRAEKDLKRIIAQMSSGTIAQQEIDKAIADERSGKARVIKAEKTLTLLLEGPRREQIDAMKAELSAAEGRFDEAKRMLDNCIIKAPITGTVLSKKTDVGGLVNPLAFSSSKDSGGGSSGSVCEIADLTRIEVELDVPERDIVKVKKNRECQIVADADVNRIFKGHVDRIMPVADDSKNIIKVRIAVDLTEKEKEEIRNGAEPFLKPKMSAVVTMYNRDYTP